MKQLKLVHAEGRPTGELLLGPAAGVAPTAGLPRGSFMAVAGIVGIGAERLNPEFAPSHSNIECSR